MSRSIYVGEEKLHNFTLWFPALKAHSSVLVHSWAHGSQVVGPVLNVANVDAAALLVITDFLDFLFHIDTSIGCTIFLFFSREKVK